MSLEYQVNYNTYDTFEEAQSEANRDTIRYGNTVTIYKAFKTVAPNDEVMKTMTTVSDWVDSTPETA